MANLFYIAGTNPSDLTYDMSLLVSADTPEQALELWAEHYYEGEEPEYDIKTILPPISSAIAPEDCLKIYRVKHDLYHTGVLKFSDPNQMEHRGYVLESR